MRPDLHTALTEMAVDGGDPGDPPTARLRHLVRRRRAVRTAATSAVGVTAAGAAVLGLTSWFSHTPAPGPLPVAVDPAPDDADPDGALPAPNPSPGAVVGVWDLVPDSALDLDTVPERAVTEALAGVTLFSPEDDAFVLYLLDAADNTWVRSPWPGGPNAGLHQAALSPDGRTIASSVFGSERPRMRITELATGEVTDVAPLVVDGVEYFPTAADYAPDGGTLAILGVADPTEGPVTVFEVDPASGDVRALATFDGVNLAEVPVLAYSPDGTRLAVTCYEVREPYRPAAVVLDRDGKVLREWDARLAVSPWYGNDALRASGLTSTDDGEWVGYLLVDSGDAVGSVQQYPGAAVEGEDLPGVVQAWDHGTPPAPVGATHGRFVMSIGDSEGAFRIEDPATGAVRTWLRLTGAEEFFDATLLSRER